MQAWLVPLLLLLTASLVSGLGDYSKCIIEVGSVGRRGDGSASGDFGSTRVLPILVAVLEWLVTIFLSIHTHTHIKFS